MQRFAEAVGESLHLWSTTGTTCSLQCHAVPGRPVDCYKAIHDTIEDTEVEMRTPMVQSCRRTCSSPVSHETVDICGCQRAFKFSTPKAHTWHDRFSPSYPFFNPVLSFLSFRILSHHFLSVLKSCLIQFQHGAFWYRRSLFKEATANRTVGSTLMSPGECPFAERSCGILYRSLVP